MMCSGWRAVALLLALALAGCQAGATSYSPKLVAHAELTLRYDDGVEIYAGKRMLAKAPRFEGLADFVRCVPEAHDHALAAEDEGSSAVGTGWAGGILGVAGLGGLAGLGYLDSDETTAFALLGTGVAVGLVGVVLAAISRGMKNRANGHAVDALNYYNDAVGSLGASCREREPRPAQARPGAPPPAGP